MPTIKNMANQTGDAPLSSECLRCYLDPAVRIIKKPAPLSGERLLTEQALRLVMVLDAELRTARADWNQDRFRRVMVTRHKAVLRVFRRWSQLNPQPSVALGNLRRRYHANLSGYLYHPK